MRKILALFAVLCLLVVSIPLMAYAQDPLVASDRGWIYDWLPVLRPFFELAVTLFGTPLLFWIAAKLALLIGKNDETARLKIEGEIRNALHQAAANALKFAIAKRTGTIGDMIAGVVPADLIADAVSYVRSKNPDAAANINDTNLIEIILSKVPDVQAIIEAGKPSKPAVKPSVKI